MIAKSLSLRILFDWVCDVKIRLQVKLHLTFLFKNNKKNQPNVNFQALSHWATVKLTSLSVRVCPCPTLSYAFVLGSREMTSGLLAICNHPCKYQSYLLVLSVWLLQLWQTFAALTPPQESTVTLRKVPVPGALQWPSLGSPSSFSGTTTKHADPSTLRSSKPPPSFPQLWGSSVHSGGTVVPFCFSKALYLCLRITPPVLFCFLQNLNPLKVWAFEEIKMIFKPVPLSVLPHNCLKGWGWGQKGSRTYGMEGYSYTYVHTNTSRATCIPHIYMYWLI